MDPISLPVLGIVGVGFVSGALSGLLGVGGATVSTPGVRLFGATPIQAVGSTIPAVLPSAIIGSWRYAKAGMVEWPIALTCGAVGSVAAVGGAFLSDDIDARFLMILTAAVLLWSGLTVLRSGRKCAEPAIEVDELEGLDFDADLGPAGMPGPVAESGAVAVLDRVEVQPVTAAPPISPDPKTRMGLVVAMGLIAGLVAGLLGIGGGVVMMPMFTGVLKVPVKRAVPTSLVAVALFSIPALAAHMYLGHVNWTIALALMVGVAPGARLGSKWSMKASDEVLRRLFGLFLVILALLFGVTQLLAL